MLFQSAVAEHVPAAALDRIVGLVERAADRFGDSESPQAGRVPARGQRQRMVGGMDVAGARTAVGDPGDADQPEHGGQPPLVAGFSPWPNPALGADRDRARAGPDLLLLPLGTKVQVVLQH